MRVPGMLYGKVFRSTVAHGRIVSIDVSEAREIAGVHAVITGEDIKTVMPNPYYGPAFHDQPILALEKVRYVGEAVAVVLAADPHIAERAVQTIVAEYEELEPVFDEVEAVTSTAIVHDELKPAGTFADLKHLAGPQEHQRRARLSAPPRRCREGDGVGRSRAGAHIQDAAMHAHAAGADLLGGDPGRRHADDPFVVPDAVLRADGDRAAAWAGRRTRSA